MGLADQLPALQVAVPLIGAPLCALMGRPRPAWLFAVVVAWLTFAVSVALLEHVLGAGPIHYAMGGWPEILGIAYVIDPLNALVMVLVSGMAAIIMPATRAVIDVEVVHRARHLFHTMALLALAGMLGIAMTGDVFNLYVFLEISSLASYALVAMGVDRRATRAAFHYLVQGTIGATFILVGIGLAYMMTGTLNMADMATRLPDVSHTAPIQAALAFILIGTAIKAAIFPAHSWMPNAYTYAPSLVSAFFGATATKIGAYMLLRLVYSVFGADYAFGEMKIGWLLVPLGLAGAVAGSIVAVWQHDLRRMLAYSSVAQVGYIAAAIGFANHDGLVAAIVHVFNHGLMKGALFLIMACVIMRLGKANMESFRGLGRRMPVTMGCFVVAGLSMIGVPGTVGFVSKWYLVSGALDTGLWPLALVIVATSLIAVVYIWRVVDVAYFSDPSPGARDEAPAMLLMPAVALCVLCVVLGISTDLTVGVADAAARLLGGAP